MLFMITPLYLKVYCIQIKIIEVKFIFLEIIVVYGEQLMDRIYVVKFNIKKGDINGYF